MHGPVPVPQGGPAPDFFPYSARLTRVRDEADVTRVRFLSRLRGGAANTAYPALSDSELAPRTKQMLQFFY